MQRGLAVWGPAEGARQMALTMTRTKAIALLTVLLIVLIAGAYLLSQPPGLVCLAGPQVGDHCTNAVPRLPLQTP